MRDAAIIPLGAGLATLTLADIESKSAGRLVTVRRSKTDQEGHGHVIGVAHGNQGSPTRSPPSTAGSSGAATGPCI